MAQRVVILQRVSMLFLAIVGGYIAADTTSFLLGGPMPASEENVRQEQFGAITKIDSPPLLPNEVNRWNLFGSYQGNTSHNVDIAALPETDLELELLGLFADSENSHGAAIITRQGKDAVLLSTGDALEGSGRISSILKDRVVIEHSGEKQVLMLTKWANHEGIETHVTKTEEQDQGKNNPENSTSPPSYSKFIKHAGLKPVNPGVAAGYLVGDDAKGMQEKYNLRKDDVILSVNGYPVGAESDDRLAGSSLMDGKGEMVVRREGQTFTLKIRP